MTQSTVRNAEELEGEPQEQVAIQRHQVEFPYDTALVEVVAPSPRHAAILAALHIGEREVGRIAQLCHDAYINVKHQDGTEPIKISEILDELKSIVRTVEEFCSEQVKELGLIPTPIHPKWLELYIEHMEERRAEYGQVLAAVVG